MSHGNRRIMSGLSPHTTMTEGSESRSTKDVVETALSLLKNRREAVHAKPGSQENTIQRACFQKDVTSALQGSLLPADQRRVLMSRADELGMRPFEATLMIGRPRARTSVRRFGNGVSNIDETDVDRDLHRGASRFDVDRVADAVKKRIRGEITRHSNPIQGAAASVPDRARCRREFQSRRLHPCGRGPERGAHRGPTAVRLPSSNSPSSV